MFAKREMKSEVSIRLASLVLVLLAFSVGEPASPQSKPDEKLAAIKQSIAQNQAALRNYTWTETTEISLKGEVKKIAQKQVRYGADGTLQKTPIPGTESSQQGSGRGGRGGRIREEIVAKKTEDLKDYMERAAALVHEYVPPDPKKLEAAAGVKGMAVQSAAGLATMTINDYLKPGDSLALGFDSAAKQLRSYKVQSYVDKPNEDALTLDVTFASLPDGTSYPQQTVLDASAKNGRVKITNSGYTKTGP